MASGVFAPYTQNAGARIGDFRFKGTNIDRRQCRRTRPMQVLCLGRERTGTASIREALFQLGYAHVYHYASLLHENPRDSELWRDAFVAKYDKKGEFGRDKWDRLLGHCAAISDVPCALFAPELLAAYPDAKVVLTVRDSPRAWAASILGTMWRAYDLRSPLPSRNPLVRLYRWLRPVSPTAPIDEYYWPALGYAHDPAGLPAVYEAHNAEVLRAARAMGRDVLVFNVKEGWGPLCAFLGKEVPDTPFPNVNNETMFRGDLDFYKSILMGLAVVHGWAYIAGAAAVAFGVRWWLATVK